MPRGYRYLRICIAVLYAAFGSGPGRRINREDLERAIGRKWTIFALSLPFVLVAAWLLVWLFAKIVAPEGAPSSYSLPF